jgi:hypothetical protein
MLKRGFNSKRDKMKFVGTQLSCAVWLVIIILIPIITYADDNISDERYIPDISTFMKIGRANSPAMGINGEFFFAGYISGVRQVYRLTNEGWPYQLTLFDDGIDWYKLSFDGERAIVGASVGGSEDAQLFLMETKAGRVIQITDNPKTRYGSVVWKKDGSGFFYRAN